MIPYPRIDPVIVSIGPLALRWYGLMYLAGFVASFGLVRKQILEECPGGLVACGNERVAVAHELRTLEGILVALVLGVILGGRIGYVLFYNPSYYLGHPWEILATWQGGMSFHGGALGAAIAGWLYCRANDLDFWKWAGRFVVTAPIGLGLGRIGNFINGELYGRPSDVPWAMIFPQGGDVPRHPSQLYEALLEGLLLFVILWPLRRNPYLSARKLPFFFVLYALCRMVAEFFREPDPQLGYILWGWVTMGQVLSLALLFLGLFLWWLRARADTSQSCGQ
jgi:phosphatidylglycerol:prolipoprotein diacylglycerol transferase